MSLKRTQSGKVDKRTKEYREMCRNLAKARRAHNRKKGCLPFMLILPIASLLVWFIA